VRWFLGCSRPNHAPANQVAEFITTFLVLALLKPCVNRGRSRPIGLIPTAKKIGAAPGRPDRRAIKSSA
jgi:hypothetical protein